MAKCRELKSIAEWETIFPLIQELRDHLSLEIFLKYAHPMHENGYHLFVIEENEVIMGVAGVAVLALLLGFNRVRTASNTNYGNNTVMPRCHAVYSFC